MDLSPEERQRRSERARELVKSGRFGGPQPGSGRPRKKRASEVVAEEAAKNADLIVSAFKNALEDNLAPHQVKVAAAKEWLAVEGKDAELQQKEEELLEKMSRDELIKELVDGIGTFQAMGAIDVDFEELPIDAIEERGSDQDEQDELIGG